jgi:hypothetical protein
MRAIAIILLPCLVACAPPGPDETRCNAGSVEADIRTSPLVGPAVDAATQTLKPGNYFVSTTYIKLTLEPEGQRLFQELTAAISDVLPTTPGLLASQLSTSTECLSARTLAVWSDEKSMFQFSAGEVHSNAIRQAKKMSRGGGGVTHWADTEQGVNFEKAAQQVAADIRPGF